jgi:DNA-directed RNA polymerase subunit K/omega
MNKNIVKPEERITSNILSKSELIQIIGNRSEQIRDDVAIGKHQKIFVDINTLDQNKLHDPIYIAMQELKQFKLPFIIERKIGNSRLELWHLITDKMIYLD